MCPIKLVLFASKMLYINCNDCCFLVFYAMINCNENRSTTNNVFQSINKNYFKLSSILLRPNENVHIFICVFIQYSKCLILCMLIFTKLSIKLQQYISTTHNCFLLETQMCQPGISGHIQHADTYF